MEATMFASKEAGAATAPGPEKAFVTFTLLNDDFNFNYNGYTNLYGQPILYPNRRDGEGKQIPWIKDKQGYDVLPQVRWEAGYITVPGTNADLLKFLREAPWCKGSELQLKQGYVPKYKERDDERDALASYSSDEELAQAMTLILNLDDEKVRQFALAEAGCYDGNPINQRAAAMSYAKANPKRAIEALSKGNPDLVLRAAINWALNWTTPDGKTKLCTRQGDLIKMHGVVLGSGIDGAMAFLKGDAEMKKVLMDTYKKNK